MERPIIYSNLKKYEEISTLEKLQVFSVKIYVFFISFLITVVYHKHHLSHHSYQTQGISNRKKPLQNFAQKRSNNSKNSAVRSLFNSKRS